MNIHNLQTIVQQSAMTVGNLRGVHIKAIAGSPNADEGITIAVVITTEKAHGPEFPCDLHLRAAELSLSDTRFQSIVERSFETSANEFNAQHGKGAYDAGLNWKRR